MSAASDTGAAATPAAGHQPAAAANATLAFVFHPMRRDDLGEVEALEYGVYSHPWTKGNFQDSLDSGYQCWLARDTEGKLAGYFLLMLMPDEAHLLNITVAPAWQGRGLGRVLLERAFLIARNFSKPAVLLEVRPSNPHALAIYRHVGFRQIGLRKNYYPAADGQREDAIVMRLPL
jgi:ribosomal-protein-alanine N-acetyltransferase